MNNFFAQLQQQFAPEDAGGGQPAKSANKTVQQQLGDRDDRGGITIADLFKDPEPGEQLPEKDASTAGNENEQQATDANEAVEGQAQSGDAQQGEAPEPVKVTEGQSLTIGERQYSYAEVQQAIKDAENNEQWRANNANDSQTIAWLQKQSPEVQDKFRAYAIAHVFGKDKLPEGTESKSLKLKVADENDEMVQLELVPDSKEYEATKKHFEAIFMAQYAEVFDQLKHYQETEETRTQEWESAKREQAYDYMRRFVKTHGINVPTEGDLEKGFRQILQSGPQSPYYISVLRLTSAADIAKKTGMTLDQAYKTLVTESSVNTEAARKQMEADKAKQKGVKRIGAGSGSDTLTDDEQFIASIKNANTKRMKVNKLYGD